MLANKPMENSKKVISEEKKESVAGEDALVLANGETQELVNKTFKDLGLCPELCEAVEKMKYKQPSKI